MFRKPGLGSDDAVHVLYLNVDGFRRLHVVPVDDVRAEHGECGEGDADRGQDDFAPRYSVRQLPAPWYLRYNFTHFLNLYFG